MSHGRTLAVGVSSAIVEQLRVEKLAYQFANLDIGDKEGVVPIR